MTGAIDKIFLSRAPGESRCEISKADELSFENRRIDQLQQKVFELSWAIVNEST
jgi:hypothetical protein